MAYLYVEDTLAHSLTQLAEYRQTSPEQLLHTLFQSAVHNHNGHRSPHTPAALQENEDTFRSFFEQPLIGMAVTAVDKSMLLVNDKLCQMLGYSREELLCKKWSTLTHPDDLLADIERFEQMLSGGIEGYSIDKRFIRKDGTAIPVCKTCRCLRDTEGRATRVVTLVEDITERKQLEDTLRASLERERELGQLKSRFLSMVSHEFRNPLAAIMMSSDMLKKYSDRMDADRKTEHLNRIQLEVRRLTDLLEDVLVMNRGQTVGVQFNPTGVDLEMLCHDIVAGMQSLHPRNPIEYSRSCSSTFMWLDEKLMRQAITNLMSNAIKYSYPGGQVHLHLTCDDREITIQVRDHGRGIPKKDQPNLFQTFYRASNVGSIAGTGLGLAIVKMAVEAHDGVVTFESEQNAGTTFTITLPLRSG